MPTLVIRSSPRPAKLVEKKSVMPPWIPPKESAPTAPPTKTSAPIISAGVKRKAVGTIQPHRLLPPPVAVYADDGRPSVMEASEALLGLKSSHPSFRRAAPDDARHNPPAISLTERSSPPIQLANEKGPPNTTVTTLTKEVRYTQKLTEIGMCGKLSSIVYFYN